MRVGITRLDPTLPLPAYQTAGATGFDLYARADTTIPAGGFGRIAANVIVCVPEGHVLIVALRSSTPERTGLVTPNGIGVIDSDYCGPEDEIKILVYNTSQEAVEIRRGERVAQGLLMPIERVEWDEIEPRRSSRGGFGSTG